MQLIIDESKMVKYHVNKCKLVSTRLHNISLQDLIANEIKFLYHIAMMLNKTFIKITIINI